MVKNQEKLAIFDKKFVEIVVDKEKIRLVRAILYASVMIKGVLSLITYLLLGALAGV